jgi:hypothetical protein
MGTPNLGLYGSHRHRPPTCGATRVGVGPPRGLKPGLPALVAAVCRVLQHRQDLGNRLVGGHVLPQAEHCPSGVTKPRACETIPLDVALELRSPVVIVGFGPGSVFGAAVPEATIDEDREPRGNTMSARTDPSRPRSARPYGSGTPAGEDANGRFVRSADHGWRPERAPIFPFVACRGHREVPVRPARSPSIPSAWSTCGCPGSSFPLRFRHSTGCRPPRRERAWTPTH